MFNVKTCGIYRKTNGLYRAKRYSLETASINKKREDKITFV